MKIVLVLTLIAWTVLMKTLSEVMGLGIDAACLAAMMMLLQLVVVVAVVMKMMTTTTKMRRALVRVVPKTPGGSWEPAPRRQG